MILGEKDVKKLDDLADLAGDELVEMLGEGQMSVMDANKVIIAARAHWFEEEDQAIAEAEAAAAEAEAGAEGAEASEETADAAEAETPEETTDAETPVEDSSSDDTPA